MSDQIDLTQLAKRAQQGDKGAFDRLAELAAVRLRLYVFRLTLQEDLAEDIVQETLLEMVKILGKLKKTDRFWPWLYGIATNKLRHHYRSELVHRKVAPLGTEEAEALPDREEGVENLVTQEIKQIVSNAVKSLKTSHRAVLIMRCYDNMSYAEIAHSMGCTEFGSRMLFLRAKKALEKQLARNGLKKGSLLGALLVFGKITAPTQVAAAQVAVTAAALDVGLAAGIAGLATGKAALVSLAAVGMVGIGTGVQSDWFDRQPIGQTVEAAPAMANVLGAQANQVEKHTYFLPEGPYGPLMLRAQADQGDWVVLQNAVANYTFDGRILQINNHRRWASDLGVVRLPTDPPAMVEFLSRVEGLPRMLPSTRASGKGLLVEVDYDRTTGTSRLEVLRNPNVSDEDYFQSNWPLNVRQQDNRDLMHRRGWTFFRIDGEVHGRRISGEGRLAFVYQSYQRSRPWLRLRAGDLTIHDHFDRGASVTRQGDGHFAVYRGGSFFKGLARPWAGLHTIDLVRRDAAEKEVWFRTLPGPQPQGKVQVALDLSSSLQAVYTIDLEVDVVDHMDFVQEGKAIGMLDFTYLQDVGGTRDQFLAPTSRITQGPQAQDVGVLWLAGLVEGSLGQ